MAKKNKLFKFTLLFLVYSRQFVVFVMPIRIYLYSNV